MFWILLCAVLVQMPCMASVGKDHAVELEKLDDILSRKSVYDQYLLDRVKILRDVLAGLDDSLQVYDVNKKIASEYMSYCMDSTMYYLGICSRIADNVGDRTRALEADIMLAEEYTLAGYHLEASEILRNIDPETLPDHLKHPYLTAQHNLAGELLAYATDPQILKRQGELRTYYRNQLLQIAVPETFEWYRLKREEAIEYGSRQDALEYSRKLLDLSEEGSHDYAIACYLYQEVLDKNTQMEEKITWLIRSSYADVLCATKDYASLNYLASYLFGEGDIDRAFSYTADYCMPDAIFFGGKLRPWQTASFFPAIGRAYQDKNTRWQHTMNIMLAVLCAMIVLLALLSFFIYLRQQVLDKTRKALQASYLEIEKQNADLVDANRQLSSLNAKILESDKVKQEYIALFLSILSENINTTRQYKNHVLKYIRRGNEKEIAAEIESLPPIDNDINEFYKMFDHTFLNLYPDFVDKVNALLADGEKIVTKGDDCLTPELRVFALIKLGITDSSKIASLLHYSANTIYNYRAKIKNKARGDRSGFEDAVKMI